MIVNTTSIVWHYDLLLFIYQIKNIIFASCVILLIVILGSRVLRILHDLMLHLAGYTVLLLRGAQSEPVELRECAYLTDRLLRLAMTSGVTSPSIPMMVKASSPYDDSIQKAEVSRYY